MAPRLPDDDPQRRPTDDDAVAPPRRPRRRWPWLTAALVALTLGTAGWLTSTGSGFALLWRGIAAAGGPSAAQVSGTLWQGFTLGGVRWHDAARDVEIDRLTVAWRPGALWQRTLWLTRMDLGMVRIRPNPAAPPTPWPTLPATLDLPLAVRLDRLTLGALVVGDGQLSVYDLAARYDYRRHHGLVLERARVPLGNLSGRLSLAAQAPFALDGRIDVQAGDGASRLTVGGTLSEVRLSGLIRVQTLRVALDGAFAPFASDPFARVRRLDLQTRGVDPHAWYAGWPQAAFDLSAHVGPGAAGTLSLTNRLAGPVSSNRVPLSALQGRFVLAPNLLRLDRLTATVGTGSLALSGSVRRDRLALDAALSGLALTDLHASAPTGTVSGRLGLSGSLAAPRLTADLHGRQVRLAGAVRFDRARAGWGLGLERLRLTAGAGRLDLTGALGADRRFHLEGRLSRGNPAALQAGWPQGDINAALNADGHLAAAPSARIGLVFAASRLSGAPLAGQLHAELAGRRLRRISADLNLAGNRLKANGSYGAVGDRLLAELNAPVLSRLGFGFGGSVTGRLALSGAPHTQWAVQLAAAGLVLPGGYAARRVRLDGTLQPGAAGPFRLNLGADGVSGNGWRIASLAAQGGGTRARHRLTLDARLTLRGADYGLSLAASGGWNDVDRFWRGSLDRAALSGQPAVHALTPLPLTWRRERLTVGPGRLSVAGGTLTLDTFQRDADGTLVSRGRLDGLSADALRPWLPLPPTHGLTLGAVWALQPGDHGSVAIMRQGGDLQLDSTARTSLGLSAARLDLDWAAQQSHVNLQVDSRYGTLRARGTVAASPLHLNAGTPLTGQLQLALPDLAALAGRLGSEADFGGNLQANLAIAGPLSQPGAHGPITGRGLLWRDRKTGLRLSGGELDARLNGRSLILDRLRFAAGGGEILASGRAGLDGSLPDAAIKVTIRHFSVYDRPDRRLVVSGGGTLDLGRQGMVLNGLLRADQGHLALPKAGIPTLSDDVVIVGRPASSRSSLADLPLTVALTLDLGDRFVFSGQGLNVALSGKVDVRARQGTPPSAHGQVNVVRGSYRAYGQELDIQSGSITFVGPLDNPNLSVRATRHLSPVGAGVEVTGSLSSPKLTLIADESMSERDKLSWLVLGHAASDNAEDSNFLALAAGSFAAGSINQRIGLFDDLGLTRRQSRTLLNGTVSPAEQVLTVGKQLSQTFYLGYEYGLTSSQQAIKLIYQLSGNWSLLLRIGNSASTESRYTLRFD